METQMTVLGKSNRTPEWYSLRVNRRTKTAKKSLGNEHIFSPLEIHVKCNTAIHPQTSVYMLTSNSDVPHDLWYHVITLSSLGNISLGTAFQWLMLSCEASYRSHNKIRYSHNYFLPYAYMHYLVFMTVLKSQDEDKQGFLACLSLKVWHYVNSYSTQA